MQLEKNRGNLAIVTHIDTKDTSYQKEQQQHSKTSPSNTSGNLMNHQSATTNPLELDKRQESFATRDADRREADGDDTKSKENRENIPSPSTKENKSHVRFRSGPNSESSFQAHSRSHPLNINHPMNTPSSPTSSPTRKSKSTKLPISSLKNKGKGSPNRRPSVFERLSNAETVASIHRKLVSRQIRRSTSAPPRLRPIFTKHIHVSFDGGNGNSSNRDRHPNSHSHPHHNRDKKGVGFNIAPQTSFERLAVSHTKLSKIRQRRRGGAMPSGRPSVRTNSSNGNGKHKVVPVRKNGFQRSVIRRVRSTSRGRLPEGLERWNTNAGGDVNANANNSSDKPMYAIVNMNKNIIGNSNIDVDNDKNDNTNGSLIRSTDFDEIDGNQVVIAPLDMHITLDHEDDYSTVATGTHSVPILIEFNSRMQIYTTDTHLPEGEVGFQEVDTAELQLNGCLAEYEAGGLSVKEVASEIISTFLMRDLPADSNWRVGNPMHRKLALPLGETGYSFYVEAHDGEDVELLAPASASATGSIIFIHDLSEIHIENYSFVLNEI